jgi:hypothetical protein
MIRALQSSGPARRFFRLAPLSHVLVYHPEQIAELREVAARPLLDISSKAVDELVDASGVMALWLWHSWMQSKIAAIPMIITYFRWLLQVQPM